MSNKIKENCKWATRLEQAKNRNFSRNIDKNMEERFNNMFPLTFINAGWSNGTMQRGIQEATCIRRPTTEEKELIQKFENLLFK